MTRYLALLLMGLVGCTTSVDDGYLTPPDVEAFDLSAATDRVHRALAEASYREVTEDLDCREACAVFERGFAEARREQVVSPAECSEFYESGLWSQTEYQEGCRAYALKVLALLDAYREAHHQGEYPWCSWSGELKNGKPHGWGAGSCVMGQEPTHLRDRHPVWLPEQSSRERSPSNSASIERVCADEVDVATWGMIDDYPIFRGHYVDGKREGEGTYFYPDGTIYIGNWKDDQPHGVGAFFTASCVQIS